MNQTVWEKIAVYTRGKVAVLFDPTSLPIEDETLPEITEPHQGFYIAIHDPLDKELVNSGFLQENLTNIKDSLDKVIAALFNAAKAKNLVVSDIQTGTFYFTLVINHHYLPDPLAWDQNSDGIYFQWGQDYKGMYLPYEIKKMNMSKSEILDRLCCHRSGIISSAWRDPCGLVFKLVAESFSA